MTRRPLDVLFTVGHDLHPGQSGALGLSGIRERYLMGAFAPGFARAVRAEGLRSRVLTRREEVNGYTSRSLDLCERVAASGARVVVDLHHNGGGYPGSLALANDASLDLARAVSSAVAIAQGTKDLGARQNLGTDGVPRSWGSSVEAGGKWYPAGSELFILTRCGPACLPLVLEPFDGSVEADHDRGIAALRAGTTQSAVAKAIAAYLAAGV